MQIETETSEQEKKVVMPVSLLIVLICLFVVGHAILGNFV